MIPIALLPGLAVGLTERLERWMSNEDGDGDGDGDGDCDKGEGGKGRRRGWDKRRRAAVMTNTNPLNHTSSAPRMQMEFNTAYRDEVLDEYCRH